MTPQNRQTRPETSPRKRAGFPAKTAASLLAGIMLVACSSPAASNDQTSETASAESETQDSTLPERIDIFGTASYRERIALQPGFTLRATLIDASDGNRLISETERKLRDEQVPLDFRLETEAPLNPDHDYTVIAELIGPDGTIMWRGEQTEAVKANDPNQTVDDLLLRRVSED